MGSTYHLFIDTNVLLSFHAFTDDDLEQLKKIVALLGNQKLSLYLTKHVIDEFWRNRESKLAETLKSLDSSVVRSLPRFVEVYEEAAQFRVLLDKAEKLRKEILSRARYDALKEDLLADRLIKDIIKSAIVIPIDEATLSQAVKRNQLGNPPGKKGNLGDRLNWEALVAAVPANVDLHIITRDGDYGSALDPKTPHTSLVKEWRDQKSSDIFIHAEIRKFMMGHFPEIKFAADILKSEAMSDLIQSGSFSQTHAAVANLGALVDVLQEKDIYRLAEAAIENNQIRWIAQDEDVKSFYKSLLPKAFHLYDAEMMDTLSDIFKVDKADLIPF